MKIGVFPADLYGCGYYRMIWPSMQLKLDGYDIDIISPADRGAAFSAEIVDDEIKSVRYPTQYDVIVFQRITHKWLAKSIPFIRAAGTAVIIDVDDDLETISPTNPMFSVLHPVKRPGSNTEDHSWTWARLACESATMVTCTTEALLQRYARRTTGRIIRNYVPDNALDVAHEDSNIIGWGGGVHSHAEDIPRVGNAIHRLVNEGFTFRVIGPPLGIRQAFNLPSDDAFQATGNIELQYWIAALGMLGIGIAPLADTSFNLAKSWLKPMEYAAAGVPCVMSPSPEYRAIHELGIGVIATKPKDWYRTLRELATDDSRRLELGAQSRAAAGELTIQKHAWRWAEAWEEAIRLQRQ